MRTVIIVQARAASTRLPGKVYANIYGKPMLAHVLERLRMAESADMIIVATTKRDDDLPIRTIARDLGCCWYVGSEDDVLDRYYQCAKSMRADVVVRITGDCPVIDPKIVDRTIAFFREGGYDYVRLAGYPDGLDVEVFAFDALMRAWQGATLRSEREHVTPYIWKRPDMFKTGVLRCEGDYSRLRWTVDEPRDLEFIREVYKELYMEGALFDMYDILALLEKRPELLAINMGIRRNEGYEKSLREDSDKEG